MQYRDNPPRDFRPVLCVRQRAEKGLRVRRSDGVDAAFFGVGVGFPPPASGAFVFAGFDGAGAGGAAD